MSAIGTLNTKIDDKVEKIVDKVGTSSNWVMGLCITTIIGIASMIFAVIAIFPKK